MNSEEEEIPFDNPYLQAKILIKYVDYIV